jgi:hypothetical protein
VRPRSTACLRCLDLARTDRDPVWPLLLAQLSCRGAGPPACDPVLAAAVAAQAASIVIAFADGEPLAHATINGTLELVVPGWQWRRRSWLPHPACCCGAATDCDAVNTVRQGMPSRTWSRPRMSVADNRRRE